jgi:hypothetical protein
MSAYGCGRLSILRHLSLAARSKGTMMNSTKVLMMKIPRINENTRTRTTGSGNSLAIRTSESYTDIIGWLNQLPW